MDLGALARGLAAGLAVPEGAGDPTFPAIYADGGNENNSINQCFTHTSHISHSEGRGPRAEYVDLPRAAAATQVCAREAIVSGLVGNVGSAGNASRIKGLHLPPSSFVVRKREESGKCACHRTRSTTSSPVEPDSDVPTFDERAAFLEYECGLTREQAEAQAQAELDVGAATDVTDGLPQTDGLDLWRAGLARLAPHEMPCPDYRPRIWSAVHTRALAFLDAFGAQAEALGWTAPRLFGVHPEIGTVRVDYCGGLVLGLGGEVSAITRTKIHFDHLTHYTKPGQPEGVPIWMFGR